MYVRASPSAHKSKKEFNRAVLSLLFYLSNLRNLILN